MENVGEIKKVGSDRLYQESDLTHEFGFTHHQRDGSYHKIRRESQNKRPILSVYPCDVLSHIVDLRFLLPTHTIVGVGIPPTIENNRKLVFMFSTQKWMCLIQFSHPTTLLSLLDSNQGPFD